MRAGSIFQPPSKLTDAAGTVHQPAVEDPRIVCLVPSITELLCDLGLAEQLVGRTGFCIHPREIVRTIPKVGGTKDVKVDRIQELAPTHAVVNIEENRRETAEALADFVPHMIVTHPRSPRDNLDLYRLFGGIFGQEANAKQLCASFEEVYARISEPPKRPRDVLYLIWREPWMTVAPHTYISQTLALFNWHTQPTTPSEPYPQVDLRAFAGKVDHVLLSSEPYHFRERHLLEVAAAVDGAEASLIDGEMTSWYGSRAIEGLRYLAEYTQRF
ncbi:MAG: helical backbone metal receptor [Solirubrobacteraceae bacterium]